MQVEIVTKEQQESMRVWVSPKEARLIERGLDLLINKVSRELRCVEDGLEEQREEDIETIQNFIKKIDFI